MTTFTTQDRQDAQRTPLTSTEIMNIGDKYLRTAFVPAEALEFARAIERAHGIGE